MDKRNISIGIDLGGTNTEIGWVNTLGKILHKENFKTNDFNNAIDFTKIIGNKILEKNKDFNNYNILGIGIGAPNGNFFTGNIEFAPNLKWDNDIIPLSKLIEDKTNIKTVLTNDANAAAYAEKLFGGAKNMKDFLVVTLGTGLGSGIFVNGQILYGSTGFAGEFGHTEIEHNGRQCACGKKGCLETYASATGIVKTINQLFSEFNNSSILYGKDNLSSKDIYSAAKKGDKTAIKAIEITCYYLGLAFADYTALFSPEAIFLTGGLAKAHDLIIPSVINHMNNNNLKIFKGSVDILPSELIDKNAGVLGAAAMLI